MSHTIVRFLKTGKRRLVTYSIGIAACVVIGIGIWQIRTGYDIILYNRNGEEITFLTSLKSWIRGDLEGGLTQLVGFNPKTIPSYYKSPMPEIGLVIQEIEKFDPDLKLVFHEEVEETAQVALFWNESKRLAVFYTFPETDLVVRHESSDPDLMRYLSWERVEIPVSRTSFYYEPSEGISSFTKEKGTEIRRIAGTAHTTLEVEHGPLEEWGFGSDSEEIRFFLGYDKSQVSWKLYDFRVQHSDGSGMDKWKMQDFLSPRKEADGR